jgi:hypothetical protein
MTTECTYSVAKEKNHGKINDVLVQYVYLGN